MVKKKSTPIRGKAINSPFKNGPQTVSSPKKTPVKRPVTASSDFDVFEELQKVLRVRISQVDEVPVISGYDAEKK